MTIFILDCATLKKSGFSSSGIYSIDPDGKGLMNVSCDMETDEGGWTVIQRRVDSSDSQLLAITSSAFSTKQDFKEAFPPHGRGLVTSSKLPY